MSLGDILYNEIDTDQFYTKTYDDILYNFAIKQLHLNLPNRDVDIPKTLRYADILSKSTSKNKADEHKIIAQEMISILNELFPNNEQIKYYLGNILTNNGNFMGRHQLVPNYKSVDTLQLLNDYITEAILAIPGEKDKYFFFQQMEVFNNLDSKYYSYSGPTSMGKTFLIRMFIKNKIYNNSKENYAIIVPSKALISEISRAIIMDLKNLLIKKSYKVVTTGNSTLLEKEGNFIFVLTPERLLYLLSEKKNIKINHIFIDEAHKIAPLESRSAFYYKVVALAQENNLETKVTFAAPNISNPNEFFKLVKDDQSNEKINTKSKYSPVSQIKYLIDFRSKNIQYFNYKENKLRQLNTKISETNLLEFIYNNKKDEQSIVYFDSKIKALKYAVKYYNLLKESKNYTVNLNLEEISNQIKREIHDNYLLAELIKFGIAFHVGFIPLNIRTIIEDLYKNGDIKIVFCTSTLMEGVNFPAENLFITSIRNGHQNLSVIDFKNLTGRVGRLKYSTYGKVFLVIDLEDDKNEIIEYENLLIANNNTIQLKILTDLSNNEKKIIVDTLLCGTTIIEKNEITQKNYNVLRKILTIMLKDIVNDEHSIITSSFNDLLTTEIRKKIKANFKNYQKNIDDDINHTLDQINNIDEAIKNNALEYPKIDKGVKYQQLYKFLTEMAEKFKWYKYETEDIGAKNEEDEYKLLRGYATTLNQWMNGLTINSIITSRIDYLTQKDPNITQSIEKINFEISNVLETIENIILFKFANYFLKFSTEYKKIHNLENLTNDWYEYVEYGSTKQPIILLQKLGYTRETAIIINQIKAYSPYKFIDKKFYLSKKLLKSHHPSIKKESNELYYNLIDVFIDI